MKNKIILFFLFALGIITACNNRPKEVLSDAKMEAVMVDLFLFEGAADVKNISVGDTLKTKYYNQILKKNGVTLAQYDSSLVWFVKNPKDYVRLQERVLKRLEGLKKDIKAGNYIRPIAPNDSLDSLMIQMDRRDIFIVPNIPACLTQFTIKNKGLVGGDLLKLHFQVRLDGEVKNQKASSTITVYYNDNTKDEKKMALKLDSIVNKYNLFIQTDKKKKISTVKVNIFKLEKTLPPIQRIYINEISMRRVFNPYRKTK